MGRCDTSSLYLPQYGNWRAGCFESCTSGSGGTGRKGSNDLARGLPYLVPRSGYFQRLTRSVIAPRKLGVSCRVQVPVG